MNRLSELLISRYESFISLFSQEEFLIVKVLLLAIVLAVISIFICQFYKSTSKRNLIDLNLRQYNRFEHPLANKFLAAVLYLLEYIIIMPFLLLLWFGGLSIVLLLIAEERSAPEILLIAAALIGAIRILAYYRNEISKDIAKLFPFIALALFLLSPGVFDSDNILRKLSDIPLLLNNVVYFIIVIFAFEIILRVFYMTYEFGRSEDERMA